MPAEVLHRAFALALVVGSVAEAVRCTIEVLAAFDRFWPFFSGKEKRRFSLRCFSVGSKFALKRGNKLVTAEPCQAGKKFAKFRGNFKLPTRPVAL